MRDGIVFIDKNKVILQLCAYKKQYYFVTEYFILKFTSATVLRIQGNRVEFKTSRFVKPRHRKLVFQRDSEISYLGNDGTLNQN